MKDVFSGFDDFIRSIHVSTVAIKAKNVGIECIPASIKIVSPKSRVKMSRQLRWTDPLEFSNARLAMKIPDNDAISSSFSDSSMPQTKDHTKKV